MNKKLHLIGISFAFITANAQFNAGQNIFTGSFGINVSNANEQKNADKANGLGLFINPSFGKFSKNNSINSWGFLIGFDNLTSQFGLFEEKQNSSRFGLQYNYTKLFPVVSNFYFTMGLGVSASLGSGKNKNTSLANEVNSNFFNTSVGLSPGFMFPISKKVLLQTGFNNMASLQFNSSARVTKNVAGVVLSEVKSNAVSLNGGTNSFNSSGIFLGFTLLM